MICQHYAAALVDLAASGSEPNAELRAHLQACPSCRAAYQQERNLFASIDSSMRASGNAEAPAAFIQRVRAAVNQQENPTRVSFLRPRIVFAVTAAIILFFVAYSTRRAKVASEENSVAQHQPTDAISPNPPKPAVDSALMRATPAFVEPHSSKAPITNLRPPQQSLPRESQILVSGDQEILLARYAEQLRHHNSLPVLPPLPTPASGVDSELAQTPALQVPPIQIAQLDVKPLEERHE